MSGSEMYIIHGTDEMLLQRQIDIIQGMKR